jgi:hypothetical protein
MLRAVRDQLPIGKYMELLHCLAMTGSFPVYEPDMAGKHRPTGEFTEPNRRLQRDTLVYLSETALAPLKHLEEPKADPALDAVAFVQRTHNLPLADLAKGVGGIQVPDHTTDQHQ